MKFVVKTMALALTFGICSSAFVRAVKYDCDPLAFAKEIRLIEKADLAPKIQEYLDQEKASQNISEMLTNARVLLTEETLCLIDSYEKKQTCVIFPLSVDPNLKAACNTLKILEKSLADKNGEALFIERKVDLLNWFNKSLTNKTLETSCEEFQLLASCARIVFSEMLEALEEDYPEKYKSIPHMKKKLENVLKKLDEALVNHVD